MAGPEDGPEIRETLLALVAEDERVRTELAAGGSLHQGYNARMREVHDRNGVRLESIIGGYGWPGFHLVGRDGAEAAGPSRNTRSRCLTCSGGVSQLLA